MNGLTYFCRRLSKQYEDVPYEDLYEAIMYGISGMDAEHIKYKIEITEGTYKGDVSAVFYASQTMDDIDIEGHSVKQIIHGMKYRLYTKHHKNKIYAFVVQDGCVGKIVCYIKQNK